MVRKNSEKDQNLRADTTEKLARGPKISLQHFQTFFFQQNFINNFFKFFGNTVNEVSDNHLINGDEGDDDDLTVVLAKP